MSLVLTLKYAKLHFTVYVICEKNLLLRLNDEMNSNHSNLYNFKLVSKLSQRKLLTKFYNVVYVIANVVLLLNELICSTN